MAGSGHTERLQKSILRNERKIMTVYLVFHENYETSDDALRYLGVFDSPEKAAECIKEDLQTDDVLSDMLRNALSYDFGCEEPYYNSEGIWYHTKAKEVK